MNIEEPIQLVVNALQDVKAKDTKVFNTEGLTDQFERVVIASGTSNRQTRALAYSVSHEVKQAGGDVLGKGSDAAKDGRFDPDERKMLEPMLLSLMKATGELLQAIRG